MSRLRVPAIAICGNSSFATSQHAAPATTSRKATSQSAAPATKKRRACIDSLPKYMRLSRKTGKWPHFLWLGSAKTSISCETSFTFHTWSVTIVSHCECTAQWREINELATTRRRRHDARDANTGPTPDPNYKREPFATHSGKKVTVTVEGRSNALLYFFNDFQSLKTTSICTFTCCILNPQHSEHCHRSGES